MKTLISKIRNWWRNRITIRERLEARRYIKRMTDPVSSAQVSDEFLVFFHQLITPTDDKRYS